MLLTLQEPGQTPLPHTRAPKIAIGIDLGTTNSVIARIVARQVILVPDENAKVLHPSVIEYPASGEEKAVTIRSIKRLMGKGLAESLREAAHFPLDDTVEAGSVRLNIQGKSVTPIEISATLLTHLKTRASRYFDEEIHRAVITVPAYFDESARQATRAAASLAGLEVLRLVSEPTAAALAYGLDSGKEGLVAVYDLGGGTFDVSLLRLEKGVFQVIATGGDTALGGDVFDQILAESFLAQVSYDAPLTLEHQARLQLAARETREKLSAQEFVDMVLWLPDRDLAHRFSRTDLETLLSPLVRRTIAICAATLLDAAVTKTEIESVVLVGGATRTPMVRQAVETFFGKSAERGIDPDTVVAVGAARQAHALSGGAGGLLLDVLPLSLGLETYGGLVEKILDRNTPIPAAKAQEFTTHSDGQTGMVIHVVQGEREKVSDCRSLAHFTLSGLPSRPAGMVKVQVKFIVDADGLLTVEAMETVSGHQQTVHVKPTYGLTEEEMAAMLYASYAHGREDMVERLRIGAVVEAQRTLTALDKALKLDGDVLSAAEQQTILQQRQTLENLLEKGSRDAIVAAMEALEKVCTGFVEARMNKALGRTVAGKTLQDWE